MDKLRGIPRTGRGVVKYTLSALGDLYFGGGGASFVSYAST